MALMIHDTTGTQTDCPKRLSRKKLKQLMPQNTDFTAKGIFLRYGRMSPSMRKELADAEREKKRQERMPKAEGIALETMVAESKPNIFKRLSGFFSNLQRKAERQSAKGK
jgi:hypothetical protein